MSDVLRGRKLATIGMRGFLFAFVYVFPGNSGG